MVLLDLRFDDFAVTSPNTCSIRRLIHPWVLSAVCAVEAFETLGLLPVTTSTAGSEATFWVPFLIDIGSPATFFSKKTIDALKMDLADHIAVEGKRIVWRKPRVTSTT
jgi:hypothetical protein